LGKERHDRDLKGSQLRAPVDDNGAAGALVTTQLTATGAGSVRRPVVVDLCGVADRRQVFSGIEGGFGCVLVSSEKGIEVSASFPPILFPPKLFFSCSALIFLLN
jgi:hypothetical protein